MSSQVEGQIYALDRSLDVIYFGGQIDAILLIYLYQIVLFRIQTSIKKNLRSRKRYCRICSTIMQNALIK